MLVSGPNREFVSSVSVLVAGLRGLRGGQNGSGDLPVVAGLPGLTQLGGDRSRHLDWAVAGRGVAGGDGRD